MANPALMFQQQPLSFDTPGWGSIPTTMDVASNGFGQMFKQQPTSFDMSGWGDIAPAQMSVSASPDMAQLGAPGAPGSGFGLNLPTLKGIVSGIGALGSLWGGFQQQKLAKKAFKFQKEMSLLNLANQVKSYNTALADRSRSRGVMESQSQAQQDQYVRDNSLSTKR